MSGPDLADLSPDRREFLDDVLAGLSRDPKSVPCKWLYDTEGARLFAEICKAPEYYPTRTEIGMMIAQGDEMASCLGSQCRLVEFGSGRGIKTRLLLERMEDPVAYLPIDISREQLVESAEFLHRTFPDLEVLPVLGDYTSSLELPDAKRISKRTAIYFPGSTIGNFTPEEAKGFLVRCARLAGPGGALLIGVDLVKDRKILEAAYDDAAGVTAAFNKNLLRRMNRELGANFETQAFDHHAPWVPERSRVEVGLASRRRQVVSVGGREFVFEPGEILNTEYSYKYTVDGFRELLEASGFRPERTWTDDDALFSVHYGVA